MFFFKLPTAALYSTPASAIANQLWGVIRAWKENI